jgi:branched-subunit amino acid transport protein
MSRRYRTAKKDLDADEASLTSANLVCRRKVFERVRFDENLYPGEDPKFITDARRAGFKVAYTPEVVVFNRRRTNPVALWKQIANYGSTRVQKETLEELLRHALFFAPAALVTYLVCLPVLLCWSVWGLLPVAAYAGLALFFAILTAVQCRRAEYAVVLPVVFFWIHLAYGVGFLSRLLRGGWARS